MRSGGGFLGSEGLDDAEYHLAGVEDFDLDGFPVLVIVRDYIVTLFGEVRPFSAERDEQYVALAVILILRTFRTVPCKP